jgi:hypothetical protein
MTKNKWTSLLMSSLIFLVTTGAAQSTALYQEDFSSYAGVKNAGDYGWSYSTNYGNYNWGIIQDQNAGTGPCLWAINGWTHPLGSPISGTNGTKIMVQALLWPQVGSVTAGLFSQDYSTYFYP